MKPLNQLIKRIKQLAEKWKGWKPHENLSDMPSVLLVIIGVPCALLSLNFMYGLHKALPSYVDAANATPIMKWGICGWTLTIALAIIAALAWHYGRIAYRCNKVLSDRWYK